MKNIDTGKVKFLWKSQKVGKFVRFVCKSLDVVSDNKLIWFLQIYPEENILCLNEKNVLYPKTVNIVLKFIQVDEKNYNKIRNNLWNLKTYFKMSMRMYTQSYTFQLNKQILT